jgi:hypothetical protein
MSDVLLCQREAARRRAAFLGLEGNALQLEVREPATYLAKALRAIGFQAEPAGEFTLIVHADDWRAFWAQAGPLIDCGC